LRLAFLGTPAAAVPPLRALVADGHQIAVAVTQPDRRRGRGGGLSPSPVKAAAEEMGIPVAHRVDAVLEAQVELGVVVAFGRLVKASVLDVVPMVNLHFSLLPRWRGAAPVERAILAGDEETGVCLMALDPGLDTGPVYGCRPVAIGSEETADELRQRLVTLGSDLLVERLRSGLGTPAPQVGEATYAAKLVPDELELRWSDPACRLHRVVRLGRAWTVAGGRRLLVLRAHPIGPVEPADPGTMDGVVVACGDGHGLELVEVQPEGKGPQPAAAWRRGQRGPVRLGR